MAFCKKNVFVVLWFWKISYSFTPDSERSDTNAAVPVASWDITYTTKIKLVLHFTSLEKIILSIVS